MKYPIVGLFLLAGSASAASFDCGKAATFVEKAICSNPALGALDEALSANYRRMLAADIGKGARHDLRASQRVWIADRNRCATVRCIEAMYRERLDAVCEYPVITGTHPICTASHEIE